MIALITGLLIAKQPTELIVDCNGIGFQIFTSVTTSNILEDVGSKITLHTQLIHREDAMQLYGFADTLELEIFRMLTAISGIGPKSAIGILSSISAAELKTAVSQGNVLLLTKMPGIGKKTAERLLIELKDKIQKLDVPDMDVTPVNTIQQDAIAAMMALGYNRGAAEKAVRKVFDSSDTPPALEEVIRLALKFALA
jgi:Holliday junction DNA helicase RuvA